MMVNFFLVSVLIPKISRGAPIILIYWTMCIFRFSINLGWLLLTWYSREIKSKCVNALMFLITLLFFFNLHSPSLTPALFWKKNSNRSTMASPSPPPCSKTPALPKAPFVQFSCMLRWSKFFSDKQWHFLSLSWGFTQSFIR